MGAHAEQLLILHVPFPRLPPLSSASWFLALCRGAVCLAPVTCPSPHCLTDLHSELLLEEIPRGPEARVSGVCHFCYDLRLPVPVYAQCLSDVIVRSPREAPGTVTPAFLGCETAAPPSHPSPPAGPQQRRVGGGCVTPEPSAATFRVFLSVS